MQNETLDKQGLCVGKAPPPEGFGEAALISDEVKEIISYRPHWIIRKGNVIFFAVILLLLTLTWFIQYPDKVNASARLVALKAPKIVTARTDGKLDKLLVVNEQVVSSGQPLAWLQSTASHQQVLQLKDWLVKIDSLSKNEGLTILLTNPLPGLSN
ncbi:MAG: hypothetical protein ACTHOF_07865, partial [Flavisolibacter sp.]